MPPSPEPEWDRQRAATGLWGLVWRPSVLVVVGVGLGIALLPMLFTSLEIDVGLFREEPTPWEINLCAADQALRQGQANTANTRLDYAIIVAQGYPFGDFREPVTLGLQALAHDHLGLADADELSRRSLALLKYGHEKSERLPLIHALVEDLAGDLAARGSRWDEAETHYRAALALRRSVPPPNEVEVAHSIAKLRALLGTQGRAIDADLPDAAPPLAADDPEYCLMILLAAYRTLDEARSDAADLIALPPT